MHCLQHALFCNMHFLCMEKHYSDSLFLMKIFDILLSKLLTNNTDVTKNSVLTSNKIANGWLNIKIHCRKLGYKETFEISQQNVQFFSLFLS